ncbi:MAG TPA: efflux RND transporter periplasmic adaptor subunit [Chthoniobacteraceae bacterium]|jgi:membrane fusion protein (multidrug efflux system)|nr:efflux RND transporter periplasmic adaptor subunit [Chthoniobacteraceae bacterium]
MRSLSTLLALLALGLAPLRAEETQGLIFPIKTVSISSPVVVQEVIDAINVEEGNQVTEGQVLVQLRNAKEKLTVKEYERVVEATEFAYKGAKSLFDQKMGSKEMFLKADTEWQRAKIQLQLAEEQLKEKTVRAPLSGVIVKKYKEAGESVDRGEKLVDIVNFDQVYVRFYVDPKLIMVLKEQEPVTIRVPVMNDAQFTGKINFIDPRIEASSGLFQIKVLIENPDHKIKAGMRALSDFTKRKLQAER